jgi:hypothetical protein
MFRAIFRNAGIHPGRLFAAVRGWQRYAGDRREFLDAEAANAWPVTRELPMLMEWNESSGSIGAYFFQDQCVAKWIHEASPTRHVDVGSRVDGFIGSLSVFREVEVLDIRPQPQPVPNVRFHQLDLMAELPSDWVECTDSLSCLHTIEHFGLGRYGDGIDPQGHLKGLAHLKRMVKPGGMLYLSTPIGPQRTEFNAHRVTAGATLCGWFDEGWSIEKCAVIDDENRLEQGGGGGLVAEFKGIMGVGIVAARKDR